MFIKKQRMIELQNINLRLRAGGNVKKRNWYLILGMLLLGSIMMNIIPIIPPTCRSVWCRPTGSGSRAAR